MNPVRKINHSLRCFFTIDKAFHWEERISMNGRERVLDAIAMKETDRVPVLPPFQGYWALGEAGISVRDSIDKPEAAAQANIELSERCGFDGYEAMWDWLTMVEAVGCEVKIPETGTIPTMEPVLRTPDDLDALERPDPHKDYRMLSSIRSMEYMRKKVGDERFIYMEVVSPFTLVGEMRGVEELMMETFLEPSFVEEMLIFSNAVVKDYCRACLGTDTDMVTLCEPTASGSLISPDGFNRFSAPYMRDCSKLIKDDARIAMVHICGDTNDRLEDVEAIDADVFSMDAQVDVGLASQKMGHAILGNIDPTEALYSGTPQGVREEVSHILAKARDRGFILGAGCDIATGSPLDNVMAIMDSL